jgi:lysozyme
MFDALVSSTYNIGIGAFGESTMLRLLNKGNYEAAAREFDRWIHGEDNGTRRALPGSIVETKKKLYFGAMIFQISLQKYPFPPHRI